MLDLGGAARAEKGKALVKSNLVLHATEHDAELRDILAKLSWKFESNQKIICKLPLINDLLTK
jgi:hypothetical protein